MGKIYSFFIFFFTSLIMANEVVVRGLIKNGKVHTAKIFLINYKLI